MEAHRQPPQLLKRSRELILGARNCLPGLLALRAPAAPAQGLRQRCEPVLSSVVQPALQPLAFLIARLKDPPA